jgi:hypothetical protein
MSIEPFLLPEQLDTLLAVCSACSWPKEVTCETESCRMGRARVGKGGRTTNSPPVNVN